MFKTILMTAAAVIVTTAVSAPAYAWGSSGPQSNGVELNGIIRNGQLPNGRELNGGGTNGRELNGQLPNSREHQGTSTGAVGFAIDGIELPAGAR